MRWSWTLTDKAPESFSHLKQPGNASRKLSSTYEEYNVNTGKANESKKSSSSFKLPGNAVKKLSNTYEEYGVNHSYALYKLDDSYEEYIERYQDYGRFSKFKSRVHSSISSYNTCKNLS